MRRPSLLIAALALCAGRALGAQPTPVRTLARPAAELGIEFSDVARIAELSDGRVVVIDGIELTVSLIDWTKNTATKVGRKGAGPKEFGRPTSLAFKGDTVLVDDPINARLAMITPDGDLSERTIPKGRGAPNTPFRGSDRRGGIFSLPPIAGKDSAPITRFDLETGRMDSLAKVATGWVTGGTSRSTSDTRSMSIRSVTYAEADYFGVLDDGTLLIARIGDYHVDAIAPDGRRTVGKPVAFERIPIPAAEQEAAGGLTTKPAFFGRQSPPSLASPDGLLWVRRTTSDDREYRYDLFDRSASRVSTVVLPRGTRVVGFGRQWIYAARVDSDDLQHLQRFPLSAAR
jgi:hypothetical protein